MTKSQLEFDAAVVNVIISTSRAGSVSGTASAGSVSGTGTSSASSRHNSESDENRKKSWEEQVKAADEVPRNGAEALRDRAEEPIGASRVEASIGASRAEVVEKRYPFVKPLTEEILLVQSTFIAKERCAFEKCTQKDK